LQKISDELKQKLLKYKEFANAGAILAKDVDSLHDVIDKKDNKIDECMETIGIYENKLNEKDNNIDNLKNDLIELKECSYKQEQEYENTLSSLKQDVYELTEDLEKNKISERDRNNKKLKHRENELEICKQEIEETKYELEQIIVKFKTKEMNYKKQIEQLQEDLDGASINLKSSRDIEFRNKT